MVADNIMPQCFSHKLYPGQEASPGYIKPLASVMCKEVGEYSVKLLLFLSLYQWDCWCCLSHWKRISHSLDAHRQIHENLLIWWLTTKFSMNERREIHVQCTCIAYRLSHSCNLQVIWIPPLIAIQPQPDWDFLWCCNWNFRFDRIVKPVFTLSKLLYLQLCLQDSKMCPTFFCSKGVPGRTKWPFWPHWADWPDVEHGWFKDSTNHYI